MTPAEANKRIEDIATEIQCMESLSDYSAASVALGGLLFSAAAACHAGNISRDDFTVIAGQYFDKVSDRRRRAAN